eukprot:scaffold19800_cov58-Cyclotella_meneghiniana.AAC.4
MAVTGRGRPDTPGQCLLPQLLSSYHFTLKNGSKQALLCPTRCQLAGVNNEKAKLELALSSLNCL